MSDTPESPSIPSVPAITQTHVQDANLTSALREVAALALRSQCQVYARVQQFHGNNLLWICRDNMVVHVEDNGFFNGLAVHFPVTPSPTVGSTLLVATGQSIAEVMPCVQSALVPEFSNDATGNVLMPNRGWTSYQRSSSSLTQLIL